MNFSALIDVDGLRKLLAGTDNTAVHSPIVVLDCRFDLSAPDAGREAYARAHIPGALFVDLNLDLAAPVSTDSGRHPLPAPDIAARRFGSLGIDNETPVVAYDEATGAFAARAWWLLRWLGVGRVAVLDGGFKAWVAAGGTVEAGAGSSREPAATLTPRVNGTAVANSAEVLDAVRDPARLVVDARDAERFAGKIEPIDGVAGHVPGAVNHPFNDNLASDGRFLPSAELRRRWEERLAGTAPANAIVMCGSGVTACHNLLAMELAGLSGAKLYAGSWSEWIRDPARPVARGARD
jgi:thiosulfate/3-mercaptopyruvate sulfurtransferase